MPILGKTTQLYAYGINELKERTITYDLTRILRGKGTLLKLNVEIKDEEAIAYPKEILLMPYFLKRVVRKGTDYVEDSFQAKTKNHLVTIKPFLVTRKKVSKAVRKALRDKTKEELISYISDKKTESLFDEIIKNKLQKSLSLKLKKIYPLSFCEIRVLKIDEELKKEQSKDKKEKGSKKNQEETPKEKVGEKIEKAKK